MTFIPAMWIAWSVLVVFMALLYLYRANLTKNEEGQIFLDESFAHEKAAQAAIVAKVNKVEPLLRVARWIVIAMSVFIVAYYVRDVMLQLNIVH